MDYRCRSNQSLSMHIKSIDSTPELLHGNEADSGLLHVIAVVPPVLRSQFVYNPSRN